MPDPDQEAKENVEQTEQFSKPVEDAESANGYMQQGLQLVNRDGSGLAVGGSTLGGVAGLVAGGTGIYKGYEECKEGEYGTGIGDMFSGAAGILGGGAEVWAGYSKGAKAAETEAEEIETFEGRVKAGEGVAGGANSSMEIIQGGQDVNQGFDDYDKAKTADSGSAGIGGIIKGGLGIGQGIMDGIATFGGGEALGLTSTVGADALAGVGSAGLAGAASVGAAIFGSAAAGVGAGIGMEAASTDSGLITQNGVTDANGKAVAESGMDKCADWGQEAAEWVDPTVRTDDGAGIKHQGGQSLLAQAVGIGTTLEAEPIGLAMDAAGTLDDAGQGAWNFMKKHF
jgi:hypothetical protein